MSDNGRLTIKNVRERIVGIDAQVPLLDGSRRQYVNFDNAASTPALRPVYDKVNEFLTWYSSVHRGTGFKSQIATEAYELAHDLVACFVGANLETNDFPIVRAYVHDPVLSPKLQRRRHAHTSIDQFGCYKEVKLALGQF